MITLATGISIYLWLRCKPTKFIGAGYLMTFAMIMDMIIVLVVFA